MEVSMSPKPEVFDKISFSQNLMKAMVVIWIYLLKNVLWKIKIKTTEKTEALT